MTPEQSEQLMDAASRLGVCTRVLKDARKTLAAAQADWDAADAAMQKVLFATPRTLEPPPPDTPQVKAIRELVNQWEG